MLNLARGASAVDNSESLARGQTHEGYCQVTQEQKDGCLLHT